MIELRRHLDGFIQNF